MTRAGRRVRSGRVEDERGLSSGCFHRIETGTFERVGGNGRAKGAYRPVFQGPSSISARQAAEEIGLRTGGGEGETHAACGFDDAGGDLDQRDAKSRTRPSPDRALRNGVADGEHEPVGGGVQHEADLVGERGAARCAIRGQLRLVQLDQVLRLAARAVESVVDPFGRTVVEVGDDEADVEPEPVASMRATARRSWLQDLALCRVSA